MVNADQMVSPLQNKTGQAYPTEVNVAAADISLLGVDRPWLRVEADCTRQLQKPSDQPQLGPAHGHGPSSKLCGARAVPTRALEVVDMELAGNLPEAGKDGAKLKPISIDGATDGGKAEGPDDDGDGVAEATAYGLVAYSNTGRRVLGGRLPAGSTVLFYYGAAEDLSDGKPARGCIDPADCLQRADACPAPLRR